MAQQTIRSSEHVIGHGAFDAIIDREPQRALLAEALAAWGGAPKRLLIIAPDATRLHSGAGELASMLYEMCAGSVTHAPPCEIHILPALGTHAPMTSAELTRMYPGVPHDRFRVHRWREDAITLGEIEPDFFARLSEGRMRPAGPTRIEVNRLIAQGGYDLIVSIGQVVPHEVAGMANHNKNILIGAGGSDLLGQSHYLGAVVGLERIMGRIDTPVRRLLDEAERRTLAALPIRYIQTVMARDEAGAMAMRGLYLGEGKAPFLAAARLAREVNITRLDAPIRKAVVYLDPAEYKSTWLGNKAIYRLRLAMADRGELIILAPGVRSFGEDQSIDSMIRRYGYRGTEATIAMVARDSPAGAELPGFLAAAAHLIHGSSEGRFSITYATGGLSREEIEGVGYRYSKPEPLLRRYDPARLKPGMNDVDGEEVFFVFNPGLGLWAAGDGPEETI